MNIGILRIIVVASLVAGQFAPVKSKPAKAAAAE